MQRPTSNPSFNLNATETMVSFLFYSVLGWGVDTAVRSLQTGVFTSDNGLGIPFSPMYGLAGLLVIWGHRYIRHWHIAVQFLVYASVSALYEYLGGWISLWLVGRRLWDYSEYPLNVQGYTDPIHAIGWGLLCLLTVYWIQPRLMSCFKLATNK